MRPMFFDYFEDETCYSLEDQYLFGEDILFAPITAQGQTERDAYLPAGRWVDVNTKETLDGGIWVHRTAAINQFIAFVREGSKVLSCFISTSLP